MVRPSRLPLARDVSQAYPEAVGRLLGATLRDLGIDEKLTECRALLAWDEMVGSPLAQHARPLRLRRGRLELAVPSPVWRTQLTFLKEDIKKRINEHLGVETIREVLLINQPLPQKVPASADTRTRAVEPEPPRRAH